MVLRFRPPLSNTHCVPFCYLQQMRRIDGVKEKIFLYLWLHWDGGCDRI
jgi:hypothetical protein